MRTESAGFGALRPLDRKGSLQTGQLQCRTPENPSTCSERSCKQLIVSEVPLKSMPKLCLQKSEVVWRFLFLRVFTDPRDI